MTDRKGSCEAELGSMTQAMKAQKILSDAAIPSTVYKTEASSSRHGCSYGIRYACSQEKNVKIVLSQARVTVKEWKSEE